MAHISYIRSGQQNLRSASAFLAEMSETVYVEDNRITFRGQLHIAVGNMSNCRYKHLKFESQLGHKTFMESDHEIISTVIPFLLIQEGQMSVTAKSICTSSG